MADHRKLGQKIDRNNSLSFFDAAHHSGEEAIASGSPANNPRVPSAEEIEELYHTVWG